MYTNREKSIAIRQLIVNIGDVERTHQETGISKNTLHRWKKELKISENIVSWEQDSKSRIVNAHYEDIRDKMLTQIIRLLENLPYHGPTYASDFANAIARLTDRIVKIEGLLEMQGQYAININMDGLEEFLEEDDRQHRLT
ncbi:MAG: hypothetical protein AAFV93_02550 [Chloroflexota bacterium]